jgi:hypothetical protein
VARMMRVMVFLLIFIFQEVLRQTAQYTTTNRTQEPMSRILAKQVTSNTAANSAQKAPLAFAHGRCCGVIVGRVGVAGLWGELILLLRCVGVVGRLLLVLTGCHALLVGLVLGVGVVVAVLWSWGTAFEAVSIPEAKSIKKQSSLVSGVSLRVARIVGAVLMALNTHLESPMLRRAEAVRPGRRGKPLVLVAAPL